MRPVFCTSWTTDKHRQLRFATASTSDTTRLIQRGLSFNSVTEMYTPRPGMCAWRKGRSVFVDCKLLLPNVRIARRDPPRDWPQSDRQGANPAARDPLAEMPRISTCDTDHWGSRPIRLGANPRWPVHRGRASHRSIRLRVGQRHRDTATHYKNPEGKAPDGR